MKHCSRHARFRDKALNRQILRYIKERGFRHLLVYMPFGDEVDITPLIATLRRKNHRIFIPFIQEFSFKMIPLRLPLAKNRYGIYQSNNSTFKLSKVDAVIIPVLGIDGDFRRIGFGKGMYDRFVPTLRGRVATLFVSRSLNLASAVITQPYDVRGDIYFTPSALCVRKRNGSMVCSRRYNLRIIGRRGRVSRE